MKIINFILSNNAMYVVMLEKLTYNYRVYGTYFSGKIRGLEESPGHSYRFGNGLSYLKSYVLLMINCRLSFGSGYSLAKPPVDITMDNNTSIVFRVQFRNYNNTNLWRKHNQLF